VKPGDTLADNWELNRFDNGEYHLKLYGPNGFFREFKGDGNDPDVLIALKNGRSLMLNITNNTDQKYKVTIQHHNYKNPEITVDAGHKGKTHGIDIPNKDSFGWYDFTVKVSGFKNFEIRYAGHAENGESSFTDPVMGRV